MFDVNNVAIEGNLGQNPDFKDFPSGARKVSGTLAVYNGKDKEDKKITMWLSYEAWGEVADQMSINLIEGNRVILFGSLGEQLWTDKNTGEEKKKYCLKVIGYAKKEFKKKDD